MSARPSAPPVLDGYTFRERIGRGGFADVYLYDQQMPRRQVAVKVLLDAAGERERQLFDAEANVMAQLSAHASIVPIYQAGVSADGRPFLVMEYCPPPNLSARYRSAPLPVPEVLETMIKVAGAVETAHRAGILHRDIKPANILINAYGAPKLTDFGIAHAAGGEHDYVAGMSVPWAAPETFREAPALDVRTDVWSLAATTWSLLAGRTPFEVPDGANDNATLMARIETKPPTPMNRAEVPAGLVGALTRAMAKDIDQRPPSALAFARSLQEAQLGLQLEATRIDVLDAAPVAEVEVVSDERTSVRPIAVIMPDALADRGTAIRPIAVVEPVAGQTELRGERTILRSTPAPVPPAPVTPLQVTPAPAPDAATTTSTGGQAEDAPQGPRPTVVRRRGRAPLVVAAIASLVACLVAVALLAGGDRRGGHEPQQLGTSAGASDIAVPQAPLPVTDIAVARGPKKVTLTWSSKDARSGDVYQWSWTGASAAERFQGVDQPRLVLAVPAPGQPSCVVIRVLRGSTVSDPSPITCVGR